MKSREQRNAYHNQWQKDNTPGSGVIGEVPKLAEGAENLMWGIEANIENIAKRGAGALEATEPKAQKKLVSVEGKGLYLTKTVDIDNGE